MIRASIEVLREAAIIFSFTRTESGIFLTRKGPVCLLFGICPLFVVFDGIVAVGADHRGVPPISFLTRSFSAVRRSRRSRVDCGGS